jgi:hypothetical protein
MTITTTKLTRAAGLCAVVAGLLFIGVQVNHPHLDVTLVTTTEWKVRQNLKLVMAVASLIGITGMYLRQVRQTGLLGLLGYLVFGAGYLMMTSVEIVGGYVLPSIAHSAPGYVNDVLAAATGGIVTGDIGQMQSLIVASGIAYLAGGFIFGIALFRADVLSRWAAALLAVGTVGHRRADLRHRRNHGRAPARRRLGHQPRGRGVRHSSARAPPTQQGNGEASPRMTQPTALRV